MTEHYFSSQPQAAAKERMLDVRLAGRDVRVTTAAGTFSPTRLDIGTAVLLRRIPDPPAGDLLDLGCGWGPIALHAGLRAAELGTDTRVWALDVNERSLDLTRRNAAALGLDSVRAVTAAEVPADLRFTAIWSNPPIRIGKPELHSLLLTWIPRLAPGGRAHLVVSKNLGADSLTAWLAEQLGTSWQVGKTASAKGFRVITATAPDELD